MKLHRLSWICIVVFFIGCGSGCGPGSGSGVGPPSPGGFGQTNVSPECGAFQQACLSRGLDSPLAVGSRMGLGISYELPGSSGPPTTLESGDQNVLIIESGVVTVLSAGVAAVLIKEPQGRVVDFIHVFATDPDELRIVSYNDDGLPIGPVRESGTVLTGDELLVSVESFAGSQPLVGLFNITWNVEVIDDGAGGIVPVASVVDDVVFGLFRIVARRPGIVRFTASGVGLDVSLRLEVLP